MKLKPQMDAAEGAAPAPTASPMAAPASIPTEQPTAAPAERQPETQAPPADPEVMQQIDDRMNEVPDNQKEFILKYMTPELAACFGIVFGNDALEYFSQFVDPSKMLQVVPRQGSQTQGATTPTPSPASTQAPVAQTASTGPMAPSV